jgi:hypothetical protein
VVVAVIVALHMHVAGGDEGGGGGDTCAWCGGGSVSW